MIGSDLLAGWVVSLVRSAMSMLANVDLARFCQQLFSQSDVVVEHGYT
jgi:hypothetical protein